MPPICRVKDNWEESRIPKRFSRYSKNDPERSVSQFQRYNDDRLDSREDANVNAKEGIERDLIRNWKQTLPVISQDEVKDKALERD
ncbi:hypothetical protein CEXT_508421 [Caerostris extrusa]|uniref:Uncharacterized protein n=1 Tax=Caerostris extrusa TaxID=172846 RepID=A0AAV4WIJ9_CAEEX|nr:hypothetical protein CEXT_508421 [Caerostris extrusa]